jgi:hypothetical protein
MAIIVCGFPGIGKSYAGDKRKDVIDIDSSGFSWGESGERNPNFPKNYIDYAIKHLYNPFCQYIVLSFHPTVREELTSRGIKFLVVAPQAKLKKEYIHRFIDRGNNNAFVEQFRQNWDNYMAQIEELKDYQNYTIIRLTAGQYFLDILQ